VISDFARNSNITYYQKIADQLKDIDMSVLFLNAGVVVLGAIEENSSQSY